MSTEKPRITIVGLGLIGGSIGLAIREAGVASTIIGHDRDPGVSRQAKRLGAVDRTEWNLISACEKADLVILGLPVEGIQETLKAIGPELRAGCVVVDTASLKAPVQAWAEQYLPEGVHFVGGDPIITAPVESRGGLEAARADLFQHGLFCIVPSHRSDDQAVKLVTDLVTIIGAEPLFYDAAEHDGLLAAVEHLPSVLAHAFMETMIQQPTWREMRKVAGPTFELATRLAATDPRAESGQLVANRENVVRWLDELSTTLGRLRAWLAAGDTEALAGAFEETGARRQEWLSSRVEGHWDEPSQQDLPDRPSLLDSFIGSGLRKKIRGER